MVGQRIRKEREKRGWSQNDLAKLLQVSRQTISKWETESAYPDVERLMQLSDLFEISLDTLIRDREVSAKKLWVQRARTGMTFWDFLSKRWWLIFVFTWCLAWLLPIVIRAFK